MYIQNLEDLLTLAVFAAAYIALYVGHQVGDHVVQSTWQCENKGKHGTKRWTGRRACLNHVITYTGTQAVALITVQVAFGLAPRTGAMLTGLGISAVTHYIADRREPLRRMAQAIGKGDFYELGRPRAGRDDNPVLGTGAYALDQTWHKFWIFVAALAIALIPW
jgi:hypothetical protein